VKDKQGHVIPNIDTLINQTEVEYERSHNGHGHGPDSSIVPGGRRFSTKNTVVGTFAMGSFLAAADLNPSMPQQRRQSDPMAATPASLNIASKEAQHQLQTSSSTTKIGLGIVPPLPSLSNDHGTHTTGGSPSKSKKRLPSCFNESAFEIAAMAAVQSLMTDSAREIASAASAAASALASGRGSRYSISGMPSQRSLLLQQGSLSQQSVHSLQSLYTANSGMLYGTGTGPQLSIDEGVETGTATPTIEALLTADTPEPSISNLEAYAPTNKQAYAPTDKEAYAPADKKWGESTTIQLVNVPNVPLDTLPADMNIALPVIDAVNTDGNNAATEVDSSPGGDELN
jgi:hypothetical protein